MLKFSIRRRFEQNQKDVSLTTLLLMPTLCERLFELLNVEKMTEELKKRREGLDKAEKLKLWNEVKLTSKKSFF